MQAVFFTLVWIVCYWFCLPVYAVPEPPIINLPKSTLESAIGFHIHSSPDVIPRRLDDFEVGKLAARAKMKAVVLKNHYASTAARAVLVNKIVPQIEILYLQKATSYLWKN
jgi:hypothetical protein